MLTTEPKKSSYSADTANCVRAWRDEAGTEVYVDDSKDPGAGRLTVTPQAWRAFLADVKAGALR